MNGIDLVLGLAVAGIFGAAVKKGFFDKGICGSCSCGCSKDEARKCHCKK